MKIEIMTIILIYDFARIFVIFDVPEFFQNFSSHYDGELKF